jgi:hypothetical protein
LPWPIVVMTTIMAYKKLGHEIDDVQ